MSVGFICLYDHEWNPLGKWTQHVAQEWHLKRKAYETDEFTAICQGFENSRNACFVGLHSNKGDLRYVAFCGIPSTKKGLTEITGVDCRSIFNQSLIVNYAGKNHFGDYEIRSVRTLFEYLMNDVMKENGVIEGIEYELDLSDLDFMEDEWEESYLTRTKEVRNVWQQLMAICHCYGLFIETKTIIRENRYVLVFKVRRIIYERSIKLSDYDVSIKLSQNIVNRIIFMDKDNTYQGTLFLNNDNSITQELYTDACMFPPVTETIIKDTFDEAMAEAYQKLADNRYKDKVTIDLKSKLGSTLSDLDFSFYGILKGYNPADSSSEKRLPVSAISEDSNGNKSIQFGRLSDYWFID